MKIAPLPSGEGLSLLGAKIYFILKNMRLIFCLGENGENRKSGTIIIADKSC